MKRARAPTHTPKPVRRYQGGGGVNTSIPPVTGVNPAQIYGDSGGSGGSAGDSMMKGAKTAIDLAKAYKEFGGGKGGGGGGAGPGDVSGGTGSPTAGGGSRKGGPIHKTYGPRIGREDGIIAAQKGEYVIRKSAVKKLGTRALAEVNKGRLPEKRMKK